MAGAAVVAAAAAAPTPTEPAGGEALRRLELGAFPLGVEAFLLEAAGEGATLPSAEIIGTPSARSARVGETLLSFLDAEIFGWRFRGVSEIAAGTATVSAATAGVGGRSQVVALVSVLW